jgi:hypothetical protein
MDMGYGLPGMGSGIDYCSIPAVVNTFLSGKIPSDYKKTTNHELVLLLQSVNRFNVPLGDNQSMSWGFRVDVLEGQDAFILKNDACLQVFVYNSAEDTGMHRNISLSVR